MPSDMPSDHDSRAARTVGDGRNSFAPIVSPPASRENDESRWSTNEDFKCRIGASSCNLASRAEIELIPPLFSHQGHVIVGATLGSALQHLGHSVLVE
jgi:hypothetical protein